MIAPWFGRLSSAVLASSERPGRVLAMEGVRGLAILGVFAAHSTVVFRPWLGEGEAARAIFLIGQTGVDLFFVLSGYLIYALALEHKGPWRGFIRRRVRRIYPPFLAAFVVYLALSLGLPGVSRLPESGVGLYVLQGLLLLPGVFDIRPLFAVAWSLSYEALYYCAAPLFVAVCGLRRRPARIRAAFILCAAAAYAAAVALWFPARWSAIALSPWHHWRLLLFPAGMLAHEAVAAGWFRGRAWQWAGGVAAALAFGPFLLWVANPAFQQPWPGLGGAAMLGAAAAVAYPAAFSGPGPLAALLSWTPLRWLGNLSYSFYLVHGLGLHAVAFAERDWPAAPAWLLCGSGFVAATAVSLALFLLVERRWSLPPPRVRAGSPSAK